MKTKNWVLELIVYLLATVWVMAACSKLADLKTFIWQVNNQPFDNRLTPFLAIGVPCLELLLVVLLIWNRFRLAGLYGTAILMTLFTVYIGLVTFNVYDRVPCGCAFGMENLSWPQHLILNTVFTVMAYTGIYLHKFHRQLKG